MICVFGTVCLDRVRHLACLPEPGGYVDVDSEVLTLGGEAANTASQLARWSANVDLLGNSIADDIEGVLVESFLAEHGLRYMTRAVHVDKTPVCDIYVTPDGERTMYGMGFRSLSVPAPDTLRTTACGWFTTDGNLGLAAEAYGLKAAEAGMKLYLMDIPPTSHLLGPGVVWQTSTRWVGERANVEANSRLVLGVVERTGCTAILTDSSRGLIVGTPSGHVKLCPVFERPSVRDSTGAGDTFRAGVLYGLDHGWALGECLAFGSAAAALAAEFVGGAQGPKLKAVEAHLASHPDIASQYD